jgi:predicted transcriptional regulator
MIQIIAKILEIVRNNRIGTFYVKKRNPNPAKACVDWNGISEPEQGRVSMNGLRRMAGMSDLQMKRYLVYLVRIGLIVIQTVNIRSTKSSRKSGKNIIEKKVPFITQRGVEFLECFRGIQNLMAD